MLCSKRNAIWIGMAAVMMLSAEACLADDGDVKKSQENATINQSTVDAWIAQLEHERLTKRQEARQKLLELGKGAIPGLAKAALSGKREVIEKSINVLSQLSQSDDEDVKEAAVVTLQMLSECDQPSTAERAKIALATKQSRGIQPFKDDSSGEFTRGSSRGRNRSVSVSNINGLSTIVVKEDGRETTIREMGRGRVAVRISDGDKPTEFVARSPQEMKKKSPEAFALYEQYIKNRGLNLNPTVGGNATANGFAGAGPGGTKNNASSKLLIEQLQELRKRMSDNPVMQRMIDDQIKLISGQK